MLAIEVLFEDDGAAISALVVLQWLIQSSSS